MKRKAQDESNDKQTSFVVRKPLFVVEETERIEDLLHFTWVDSASSYVELPSSETKDTQEANTRFCQAYEGCQTSFHESMARTSSFLRSCGVKVCKPRFVSDINPRSLNSTHIANLLNSFDKDVVLMHGEKNSVKVKGPLLLYAICYLYRCRMMLFSTRSKAVLINPINVQRDSPCFYILEHKDSYIQQTTYYALKSTKKPLPQARFQKRHQTNSKVAIKRQPQEKKPRKESSTLGRTLDKAIVDTLNDEVQPFYVRQWRAFLDKNRSKNIDTSLIHKFGTTLSKKQLPTGVIPIVKAKLEEKMRNREIPGKSEVDIPEYEMWVHRKMHRLKQEKEINIGDLVQSFLKKLESNLGNQSTTSDNNEQDGTNNEMVLDLVTAAETTEINDPSYRTVGKTLKAVVNQRFDYETLHECLQMLQTTCSRSIYGLSKAVEILTSILFCGDLSRGHTILTRETFKLQDIDFGGHQIGRDEQDISYLSEEVLKSLEDEKWFSFLGFYNILSACVGRKHLEKKNSTILNAIIDKMNPADAFTFTTTPALVSACKQYLTNFSNMWCHDFYKQDLKVVVTLLLRINLAKKRFFSPPKNRVKKNSQEKVKTRKQRKGFLKKRMDDLFEVLLKHGTEKRRSVSSVKQIIATIFNCETLLDFGTNTESTFQTTQNIDQDTHIMDIDTEMMDVDTEMMDVDTEGIVEVTQSILEDTSSTTDDEDDDDFLTCSDDIPSSQDVERDLTSKEINALVAVAMMLAGSESISGDIHPNYIKNQLYKDKQESIPYTALCFCANLVSKLRRISLKRDQEATFLNCYKMRHLRNVLVRFAGSKTKFRERKLYPVVQENHVISINIEPKTLYLLFCDDHNMFKNNNQLFTAYSDLNNEKAHKSLCENFFWWEEVERILKERNLKPTFSFIYTSQYDLKFLGKKDHKQEIKKDSSRQTTTTTSYEKEAIQREVTDLLDKIKTEKEKHRLLAKQLNPAELLRMNIGREFRNLKTWDNESYAKLKSQRNVCNAIYEEMSKSNAIIKTCGYKMYLLNKKLHDQTTSFSDEHDRLAISDELAENLILDKAIVQGIDPGIVTTASINCVKPRTLFESINRFNLLNMHDMNIQHDKDCTYGYELTASNVNDVVLSRNHRVKREKRQKEDRKNNLNDLQRKRVTRKIRTDRFYKKHCSNNRRKILRCHSLSSKGSFLTFLGNWSRNAKHIRGHVRRSMAPFIKRLESVEKDALFTINEHKSTITCNSCFSLTTKQLIRTEKGKKRIKGAVTCLNVNCPRRLSTRSTTTNRDQNGARNIALIGFCHVVSEDGLTLPPFRQGYNKPNKFNLSTHFQRTSLATLRSSGVPDN